MKLDDYDLYELYSFVCDKCKKQFLLRLAKKLPFTDKLNILMIVYIVEGKSQNAFYTNGELILATNAKISDLTQLIMGLGFEYTYVERHNIETFPDKLSDLDAEKN